MDNFNFPESVNFQLSKGIIINFELAEGTYPVTIMYL